MKKKLLALGLSALVASTLVAKEIKVGVLQPVTGPIASFGQNTLKGIKLANQHFNTLPNGDKIVLVVVDNQFDKVQNVNGYKRLASGEKVVAIEGPLASSMALSIKRFAGATKTPTVTQIATNPRVTKGSKYITRACFTDDFQGVVGAKYALKHNLKNAVIVFDMKQDYSVGLAKEFEKAYKKNGGKVLKKLYINSGDKDFNAQVAQIKRLNPDFIYAPIYAPEGGLFVRQLRAAGVKAPLMGGDGLADINLMTKLAGKAANGVMYTDHFDPAKAPTPYSKKFIEGYKAKYGKLPNAFAATGADGYILIYNAIKQCDTKANKTNLQFKQCVNNAIRHSKNVEAVTGYLTIDPKTGNPINKPAVVEEIQNGKAVFKELVKP